jgi:hypothetical protein
VWALTAALRWRLGNHTEAITLWRPALPILGSVDSAGTAGALTRIRKTAPEMLANVAPGDLVQAYRLPRGRRSAANSAPELRGGTPATRLDELHTAP